jgi:ribosomal protein S1
MAVTDLAPEIALEPKTRLTGKILKTTLAGALIDVGQPIPGVLHISQMPKDDTQAPEQLLREGQPVEVWVRRVRKDRIELTMVPPLQYEWNDIQPEMVVKGKVVRLESYGAFLDFGAERPGMIHVSELARGYVKEAKDVVKEGDEIEAKVISVDPKKRQIRLSLKALQPEVVAPEPPEREPKRAKRSKRAEVSESAEAPEEPSEPQLTVMQLAWQAAQDRAIEKDRPAKAKRQRASDSEQEEILSRTLEKRVATGA